MSILQQQDTVHRINRLAEQLYRQTGDNRAQMFRCFMYGEHLGYFDSDSDARQQIIPFSNDWYRFARPCYQR